MPFFLAGLFLAGGLALPGSVQGQITPQSINQPCTACEATSVHAADLDGDGSTDVLSTSQFDDKVAWYENNGGSYGEQQVISTATDKPQTVTAADLDGDGDLDVISGSKGDNKLVWYENQMGESGADSDGFGPAQVITSSAGTIYDVAAGKIDGDNKADIAVGTGSSGVIWFESHLGESGDDFSAANTIFATAALPKSVVLADLGGDAKSDVLYADQTAAKIAWHENTGGGFGTENVVSDGGDQPADVSAADLDKDGDSDIASISFADGTVSWYENTGGSFGGQTVINSAGSPEAVSTGDADDDGDAEIFAAITGGFNGSDRIVWFESKVGESGADSDGFSSENQITTDVPSPTDVMTANLDGDGAPELLSASSGDNKIAWYENTGGGYEAPQSVNELPDAEFPQSVVAATIDGDSDNDVVVASQGDNKVSWYENTDGDGTFSTQNLIATAPEPQEAITADLNGDDKPDVILASGGLFETGVVAWYENQTGESGSDSDGFGAEQLIAEQENVTSIAAANLDDDSDTDIVVAYGFSEVVWYENQIGEGGDADGFSSEKVIASGFSNLLSVHVADIDGDDNMDVLAGYGGGQNPGTVAWYENTDGNGSFSSENVITNSLGGQIQEVTTSTLDGDMDPDVLAAAQGGTIAWYENMLGESGASSNFSDENVITSSVNVPEDVHAADVDGDSHVDVLSASGSDDEVAWYSNTGGGTFSSPNVIFSGNSDAIQGVVSVFAADINQDNQMDVLSAATGREEVAWYENTSGVLPVEMVGIDAQVDGDAVRLTWSTASETNNAGFHIQRKEQGTQKRESAWATVGRVEGSGTTSRVQRYQFTDENLPYEADAITYRLKQVDTDGSAHYTKTVTVERGVTEVQLLGTYPNPAGQQATLRYALPERQDVEVRLYDVLGRQVRTVVQGTKEGRQEQTLDVSKLPSGVYVLRLQSDGQVRTQKLTVVQ